MDNNVQSADTSVEDSTTQEFDSSLPRFNDSEPLQTTHPKSKIKYDQAKAYLSDKKVVSVNYNVKKENLKTIRNRIKQLLDE